MRAMYIYISRCHTFHLGSWISLNGKLRCRRHFGQRLCQFWCWCAWSTPQPESLWILCWPILPRNVATHQIFMIHERCLSIPSLSFLCPQNSANKVICSQTLACGFAIRYCVYAIVESRNTLWAILPGFKTRPMKDCCSDTWPPCLAILADMLKTYQKLVVTSKNEVSLLQWLYVSL
jgi:hypothetical protein